MLTDSTWTASFILDSEYKQIEHLRGKKLNLIWKRVLQSVGNKENLTAIVITFVLREKWSIRIYFCFCKNLFSYSKAVLKCRKNIFLRKYVFEKFEKACRMFKNVFFLNPIIQCDFWSNIYHLKAWLLYLFPYSRVVSTLASCSKGLRFDSRVGTFFFQALISEFSFFPLIYPNILFHTKIIDELNH